MILHRDRQARIVMVTSESSGNLGSLGGDKALRSLRLGAQTIIAKPFDLDKIRTALAAVV